MVFATNGPIRNAASGATGSHGVPFVTGSIDQTISLLARADPEAPASGKRVGRAAQAGGARRGLYRYDQAGLATAPRGVWARLGS